MLKHLFIWGTITALFFSCSSDERSVEEKKEQLNRYESELQTIQENIRRLKSEIAAKDEDFKRDMERSGKPVNIRPVNEEPFSHYIRVQGDAHTDQNILVHPEASGTVIRIRAREGQRVEKGDPLIQLDDEVIRRNIDEVRTSLELAETVYQRQKNLWNREIGSEIEYLRAKNEAEALERNLESLRAQLRQMTVNAPISGYLDDLMIQEGEYASPNNPVFRLVNPLEMKVRARISERYRPLVSGLDSAIIRFPAIDRESRESIDYIAHMIDPGDRTFRLTIRIDNDDEVIKPNMIATVKLRDYYKKNALVIPNEILLQDQDKHFVFVFEEGEDGRQSTGKASKRYVEIGRTYGNRTEVLDGLSAGELVVVRGHNDLSDGSAVHIPRN